MDPLTDFSFPFEDGARAESVFWRKYAPALSDVHARGCKRQQEKNAAAIAASKSPKFKYIGARTGVVEKVRAIKSSKGFRFTVTHKIEGDDRAHSEITMVDSSGMSLPKNLHSSDRLELLDLLMKVMGELQPHECEVAA